MAQDKQVVESEPKSTVTPVVSNSSLEEKENSEIDSVSVDLRVRELADFVKSERDAAFGPGSFEGAENVFLSLPTIVKKHSNRLGLTEEQFFKAAINQGFEVGELIEKVGRQGQDPNKVLKGLESDGMVSLKPLSERKSGIKDIRTKYRVDFRKQQIADIGKARVISGEKKINVTKAELDKFKSSDLTKATKPVDFKKIRDPSKRQAEVAKIVYEMGTEAGFTKPQMAAILANGFAESRLDPIASNKRGEDSHGVWQFNRKRGEGVGYSVDQLQDPRVQMKHIIKAVNERQDLVEFKDLEKDNEKALTEQFMLFFEKPKDQSPKAVAGRQAYLSQANRLLDQAAKQTPATTARDQIEFEKRAEILEMMQRDARSKYRVMTDKEAKGGNVLNEIAAPGTAAHNTFNQTVRQLTDPDAVSDPAQKERAKLIANKLAQFSEDSADSIRETFSDSAFQELMKTGVEYDVGIIAKKLGLTKEAFLAKSMSEDSKEYKIRQDIIKGNVRQVAMYLTTGKLGVPAFVSYEFMDPDNYMQEERLGPDGAYLPRLFEAASRNRVQLIGLDQKGVPVYRAEGHLDSLFNKLNIFLSVGAGGAERVLRGPEGESFIEALKEGSIEGVKEAKDFTKLMLSSEGARSSDTKALVYGLSGLMVDILAPDPTIGLAKAASTAKSLAAKFAPAVNTRITKLKRAAGGDPVLSVSEGLDLLGTAATEMINTQVLINRAANDIAAGNYGDARKLLEQAKDSARLAQDAEKPVRKDIPEMARSVDRTDEVVSREIAREVPLLRGSGSDKLDEVLGFSDFGLRQDYVHPAVGRVLARGEAESQLVGYEQFFDVVPKIDGLIELTKKVQNKDTAGAWARKVYNENISPITEALGKQLSKRGFKTVQTEEQTAQVTDLIQSTFTFLRSTEASRLLVQNPTEFKGRLNEFVSKFPKGEKKLKKTIMDSLDETINKQSVAAQNLARQTVKSVSEADLNQAVVDVTNSLAGVVESRGAAHALVRSTFAKQSKIDVAPVIQSVANKYEEIGTDKLSPVALAFRAQLEDALPAMRGDTAMHITRHLDTMLKNIHDKTGESLADIYADPTRGFSSLIAKLQRRPTVGADTGADADLVSEAIDLFPDVLADPEIRKLELGNQLLTTKAIRDSVDTEGMDFVSGMVFEVSGGALVVKSVALPENLKGRGLGANLYRLALQKAKKDGLAFSSDVNPSADAQRIYARLDSEGIPFDRLARVDEGKGISHRYVISKDDLAKLPDEILATKKPEFTDLAKADEAVQPSRFIADTQTIVRVMEEATTVEDLMLQINRIARRDLNADEMGKVVSWLSSKGIKVQAKGSAFIADNPEVVEQAEQAFAKAFAAFVKDAPPPVEDLRSTFEKVRDFVVESFFSAKKAQADGARFTPSSEIEEVFGNLLYGQKPRYTGAPNLFKAIRRALVDDLPTNTQQKYLLQVSQRADRMGYPISVKELKKKVLKAYEEKSKDLTKEVRIELPGPVSLGGLRTKKAQASYTLQEWADGAHAFARKQEFIDNPATKKVALESQVSAIKELTPSQLVDQYVKESKPLAKAARFIYLGGDAIEDMRGLPPAIRDSIRAGVRITQQSVGETVTLISEGVRDKLVQYITGSPSVKFKSGRNVLSAGHDMMGASVESLQKYIANFQGAENKERFKQIILLQKKLDQKIGDKLVYGTKEQQEFEKAFRDLVFNPSGSMLLSDIFKATGLTEKGLIEPSHAKVLKSIFEITGNVAAKEGLSNNSVLQFEKLYTDISSAFKAKGIKDAPVANRVTCLIAGHGQAMKARLEWADLGLVVDAKDKSNFTKWIMGEAIDDPEDFARVQQIFQVHGYNPNFLEAATLEGLDFYVPKMARQKLAMALEQATDPTIKIEGGDLFEAIGKGIREAETTQQLAMAWTARYLKTRMVRGHFLLKSRYFWMNTMDHFNQMGQIVGFRPALVSTMRVIPQTFAANPAIQTALLGIQKAGKNEAGEILRSKLTSMGDAGASLAASLTRSSKWRGDLNDLLEGRPGSLMVDGVAYSYADLRRIGVEEGLAASFDTAELGTKIRQVGDMFISDMQKRTGLMKIPGAPTARDMVKIAEDMAEGWSERERFGAMLTLVEMGVDPRKAARLSIDALYDYAGSMSKADRHWLISVFFPFWAFQKNANRQLLDVVFSPRGAYRLGVLNRSYSKGTDFMSEMLYEDMVDPLGFNVDQMNDTERDAYEGLKNALFEEYGVPIAQIPEPLKRQIQLAFSGRSTIFEDGRWYEIDSEGLKLRNKMKKYQGVFNRFYVEKPSRSSMARFDLTRDAIKVPYAMNEANKTFHALLSVSDPNRTFSTFLIPEQSYKAAANHTVLTTSAIFQIMDNMRTIGPEYILNEDDGSDLFTVAYPLLELIQPERALLAADLAAAVDLNKSAAPYRIAAPLAKFLDSRGFEILAIDPKEDPLAKKMQYSEAMEDYRSGKIKVPPEDPYLRGGILVPTKRYYISGGLPAMFLKHSPFDELNGYMKKMEETPAEELAGARGDFQKWMRTLGIMDVRDVNPRKTAAGEAYEREKEAQGTFQEFKERGRARYVDTSKYESDETDERLEEAKDIQEKLKKSDPGDMEIDLE